MVIINLCSCLCDLKSIFIFLRIKSIKMVRMLHYITDSTENVIRSSKDVLDYFVKDYIKLYGVDHQSFTLHCISKHLIDDVKAHGSLIGHSMFHVESSFGYYKSRINGTRGFAGQYIKSIVIITEYNNLFQIII